MNALKSRYNSRRTRFSNYLAYLISHKISQNENIFFEKADIDFDKMEEDFNYFVRKSDIQTEEEGWAKCSWRIDKFII